MVALFEIGLGRLYSRSPGLPATHALIGRLRLQ